MGLLLALPKESQARKTCCDNLHCPASLIPIELAVGRVGSLRHAQCVYEISRRGRLFCVCRSALRVRLSGNWSAARQ